MELSLILKEAKKFQFQNIQEILKLNICKKKKAKIMNNLFIIGKIKPKDKILEQ